MTYQDDLIEYYENGDIKSEMIYENGEYSEYTEYYSNGNIKTNIIYHQNAVSEKTTYYENGDKKSRRGRKKYKWDESGKLISGGTVCPRCFTMYEHENKIRTCRTGTICHVCHIHDCHCTIFLS